jgi:predicted DNA-binding transcriptional regulator AlpA
MRRDVDLVPRKRVLEACGVSRATLWRVSRSGVESFPRAVKRGGRLYWREEDIEAIQQAIGDFEGRTAFDKQRQLGRARRRRASLLAMKSRKAKSPRVRSAAKDVAQGDLFGR